MVQATFNDKIVHIFDELTHSKGNEFYILKKDKYKHLFEMLISELKLNLLHNNMIYIGAITDGKFIVNYDKIESIDKIVVLAQGVDN